MIVLCPAFHKNPASGYASNEASGSIFSLVDSENSHPELQMASSKQRSQRRNAPARLCLVPKLETLARLRLRHHPSKLQPLLCLPVAFCLGPSECQLGVLKITTISPSIRAEVCEFLARQQKSRHSAVWQLEPCNHAQPMPAVPSKAWRDVHHAQSEGRVRWMMKFGLDS